MWVDKIHQILQGARHMHQNHNITMLTKQVEQINGFSFSDLYSWLSPTNCADWLSKAFEVLASALPHKGFWVMKMLYC
jgi:hypothetical protein